MGGKFCEPVDPDFAAKATTEEWEEFVVAKNWDDDVTLTCRMGELPPGHYNYTVTVNEPGVASDEWIGRVLV